MSEEANSGVDRTILVKRRFAFLACAACGVVAIAGLGVAGRFDVSIGIDRTWAGPISFAVNGAVGDDAKDSQARGRSDDRAVPNQATTGANSISSADLAAYTAAQEELADALNERFRETAAAMNAETDSEGPSANTADSHREAAAVMLDTADRLRQ